MKRLSKTNAKTKRIKRKPFKLAGTVEIVGDLEKGFEELKREREESLQRLAEQIK
jgi:hypothetical protein